jgi:hypothetical protein
MQYTYTKTTKNILDFFKTIFYSFTKLDGSIYKDEANKTYFQIVDMDLSSIEKGTSALSQYITITEELRYRPDKLGYMAYGNETLSWIILRFNSITDPFDMEVGKIIEIPDLTTISNAIQKNRQKLQYK